MNSYKPLVSKHARKTLYEFIQNEYGSDTHIVWKKTVKQYKNFVTKTADYGGKKSPHVTQIHPLSLKIRYRI